MRLCRSPVMIQATLTVFHLSTRCTSLDSRIFSQALFTLSKRFCRCKHKFNRMTFIDFVLFILIISPLFVGWNEHVSDGFVFQLENAKGASFLLIHGTDDQAIDSASGAHMVARLRKHGYNKIELHMYPGTGHLIESPYLPVCPANYHRVFSKYLGTL